MRRRATVLGLVAALGAPALGACGVDPTIEDLPADIAEARPDITVEEARFVLAANDRGAAVTGDTVDDDLEAGKTICWVVEHGGVELRDVVAELPTADRARETALMAAAITAFCPDRADQLSQLDAPAVRQSSTGPAPGTVPARPGLASM